MSSSPPTRRRGRPPGSAGAELLSIARATFIAHGFRGTTMDAIAAQAHISKASLYTAYPSKDLLYAAVVRDWVDRGYEAMRPHATALAGAEDVRRGLLQLARVLQGGLLSRPVLQMRTLIAAEAVRFPDVAADYVSRSWDRNLQLLADAIDALTGRGLLQAPDADLAAEQFTWLVVAAPLNRLTLQAGAHHCTEPELETLATEAVTTFLSRYGRGPAETTD
jgi:TetR/AcrR family transcriptional repressor of mexJK operon